VFNDEAPKRVHLTAGGMRPLGIVGSKGIPWITWKFTQIPEAPKSPT
jgi:hypothetical protein